MLYQNTRKLARYAHIVIAIVQLTYIYSPLHNWQHGLIFVQCVTTPILVISGVWITKGQKIWQWKNKIKKNLRRKIRYR